MNPIESTRRAYSGRYHNIYLFLTERCQLRCGHCYMGERLENGRSFTTERAVETVRYFRRMGGRFLTLVGGEPSLHPGLSEVVTAAREAGYDKIMLDTNALQPDRVMRVQPDQLFYVRISLDGAQPQTHDRVRGKGNFDRTIAGIAQLRDAGYAVRITSTVFRFNQHEVLDLATLAHQLGAEVLNLHSFTPEGLGAANREWALLPTEWVEFCARLERDGPSAPLEIRYPPTWVHRKDLPRYAAKGFRGCLGCSLDRLSVFPDGRCFACSLLFDHAVHLGTLGDNGFVLNRETQQNEFELFTQAAMRAEDPTLMGCPAEGLLGISDTDRGGLVSVCRLWRTEAR